MNVKIRLDIGTGAGNYATAAHLGGLLDTWAPLLAIAFNGQTVSEWHNIEAGEMAVLLDDAIESLQQNRADYEGLSAQQFYYRDPLEAYLIDWRNHCREHPNCYISIVP